MFERSAHGQSNRAMFYGVQAVIYCEGGDERYDHAESFDIMFWNKVFKAIRPEDKVRVIAKGCKDVLRELATGIIDGDIKNTFVAMDRDYDDLRSLEINDPRVWYTWGYSYENDIFTEEGVCGTFYNICAVCEHEVAIENSVTDWYSDFLAQMRWIHIADRYAIHNRRRGLEREKAKKYFRSNAYDAEPAVERERLKDELKRFKADRSTRYEGLQNYGVFTPRHCVGHIIAAFAFRVLTRLHSIYSRSAKLTEDGVRAAAITHFGARLAAATGNSQQLYYRNVLEQAFAPQN